MDKNCVKQPVLGVDISTTSYDGVLSICRQWIEEKNLLGAGGQGLLRGRYICVTSVHGIMVALENGQFRDILNNADIATPDGMPVVWALRSFGWRTQQRVYGPDLMLKLCGQAEELGHKVFLYGGDPETLAALRERLLARLPRLQIAGLHSPPFRPLTKGEEIAVLKQIRESGADIAFIGISTPKQEHWMARHRCDLPGVVMVGVGAAFNFHAGRVPQAPEWMRRSGFEWLFRLRAEPKRLWRRYLLIDPLFLPLWLLQRIGLLKLSTPAHRQRCAMNRERIGRGGY